MNQFQNLIDDCLIHTRHVESAALIMSKSGSVMAVSPTLQIISQEAQMFSDAFRNLTETRERVFHFQEREFTCVRADRNSVYYKCGGHGLILVRTSLFVIVATYNEDMSPSVCVEAVEKLAEYLREKGK